MLDSIARWWFIPVNVFISTFVGYLLGFLVVVMCQPPPQYKRFTIIMTAFGNTGNLFIAIVGSGLKSRNKLMSLNDISRPPLVEAEWPGESSSRSVWCLAEPRVVRKMRIVAEQTPIQHMPQPPTIASLLAIIVDGLEILDGAVVPSVMLILGGMLAEGPNGSKLGLRTTIHYWHNGGKALGTSFAGNRGL
ncbi:hypothetical protein CRYUN_Cryun29cG0067800 [Craigia yunnanensis]